MVKNYKCLACGTKFWGWATKPIICCKEMKIVEFSSVEDELNTIKTALNDLNDLIKVQQDKLDWLIKEVKDVDLEIAK